MKYIVEDHIMMSVHMRERGEKPEGLDDPCVAAWLCQLRFES